MALGGVRHGSVRNPSWLWEESVTLETVFSLYWSVSRGDGFLPEPRRISHRAMTDSSYSHDGFFTEPEVLFSESSKLKKKVKIISKSVLPNTTLLKIE